MNDYRLAQAISVMKINTFILFILFIHLSTCAEKSNLVIIDVASSGMGFQPDRKMVTLRTSARIVFNNDIEIYIQPEQHLHLEDVKNSNGDIDEKVKSIDTLYKVFAKKKNQEKGIEYDLETIETSKDITFDADSLWKTLSFHYTRYPDYSKDKGKLIKTVRKDNIKVDHYSLKFEIGGIDSVYKYYDKNMMNIPFSFSKRLDSLNKSKLFKVFLISNEIPKGVALPDMAVPRREFYHEMKVVKDTSNIKLYRSIIERFKRDSKRLNLK